MVAHDLGEQQPEHSGHGAEDDAAPAQVHAPARGEDSRPQQSAVQTLVRRRRQVERRGAGRHSVHQQRREVGARPQTRRQIRARRPRLLPLEVHDRQSEQGERGCNNQTIFETLTHSRNTWVAEIITIPGTLRGKWLMRMSRQLSA